jgi:colanic acid biosynthesis glycosyl transferase WcaI
VRITLLNLFFYPDSAATSQLLTDLARQLAEQGHQVTAICGASGYASGFQSVPPSATILRTRALRFNRSPLMRVASYGTFLIGAVQKALRGPRPDVILTLTTPPLLPLVGTLVKYVRGARHFIWEMDLYPEIAVDLGVLSRNGLAASIVGRLADYARRHADGIIALGDDMKERLFNRGLDPATISVVHNWADGREIVPEPFGSGGLVVHYSGNFGMAHDFETIRDAILTLRCDPRLRFIFSGAGPQRTALEAFCQNHGLANTEFRPYCDRSQLSGALGEGHIGLVTQNPTTVGSVVPSKTYGIMAASRPVLYIGSRHATPAHIIERFGCGWSIQAGDSAAVISLLKRLAEAPDEIYTRGELARKAFLKHFDRPLALARIVSILGLQPSSEVLPAETKVMATTAT